MFADTRLAARIEGAEMRLATGFAEIAARSRPEARALVLPAADGQAVYAGPGSPANKVIGLGFTASLDEAALGRIEDAWRERNEPVRFELATLADASVHAMLTARGYVLMGFENVSARDTAIADSDRPLSCTIERLESGDSRAWSGVLIEGFAHPDGTPAPTDDHPREAIEAIFDDLARASGFHRYLARADGALAGAAGLRMDDGIAQLCGAATLPAFRRRGIQSSLFARRLRDAHAAGCDLAVVTTQPGSKSQANAAAQGFALLYTRAILVKSWAPPTGA